MVDSIDIKIDEGILVKDIQISSVEPNTEDTVEFKEEQVQESEKKIRSQMMKVQTLRQIQDKKQKQKHLPELFRRIILKVR